MVNDVYGDDGNGSHDYNDSDDVDLVELMSVLLWLHVTILNLTLLNAFRSQLMT